MRMLLFLVVIVAVGFAGYAYSEGDGDMCVARANYVSAQAPHAMDKLAAKYPARVGILRGFLNQDGAIDKMVADMLHQDLLDASADDGQLTCLWHYAYYQADTDGLRNQLAAGFERSLGLAE